MAVTGVEGLPGSGKSYQVVTHFIMGALRQNRRVVTNIAGIHHDAISIYLFDVEKIPYDKTGSILVVDNQQIWDDSFYYYEKDGKAFDSLVQPGDLVVIDEAWEFYEAQQKISPRVMNFFRFHRHYTSKDNGMACDIILISQSINDIGRKVKAVIEFTYSVSKLKEVSSNDKYRVDIYQKTNLRKSPISSSFGIYKKRFFTFYDSYSHKKESKVDPNEVKLDKRISIFSTPLFKFGVPLAVIFLCFSGYQVYLMTTGDFFMSHVKTPAPPPAPAPASAPLPPYFSSRHSDSQPVSTSGPYHVPGSSSTLPVEAPIKSDKPLKPKESDKYVVKGFYMAGFRQFIVISDGERDRVITELQNVKTDNNRISFVYEGELVSTFTGSVGSAGRDPSRYLENKHTLVTNKAGLSDEKISK